MLFIINVALLKKGISSYQKAALIVNTVRYLKPIQIYWRLYLRFTNKRFNPTDIEALISEDFRLASINTRPVSFDGTCFRFLNHSSSFTEKINWNDPQQSKLWLYNLHYFDYLQQANLDAQTGIDLINQWITSNPPLEGNGWEPYPLSLRIVNWIKFLERRGTDTTPQPIRNSLYLQTRALRKQLEFHLLGNHLFKNAVALLFAGSFFTGKEAQEWYRKGKAILMHQLDEQILPDGGHFERSPMYHALILEDILDCLNILRSNQHLSANQFEQILESKSRSMLGFLEDIIHPDGTLPVFNDTAQGVAPSPDQLFSYARRLNLHWHNKACELIEKKDFGLFILKSNQIHCVVDAGKIGPDYLPGHAHCDTLSYELSMNGNRVVVNAGVFQYAGEERNNYRATQSHNTVEIDDAEQHEIWSTFRVARRGHPRNVIITQGNDELFFSAQHTGYQRLAGRPIHQRDISIYRNHLNVVDHINGSGNHSAKSYIHFHPEVEIIEKLDDQLMLKRRNSLFKLRLPNNSDWLVRDYKYSEEFGLKETAKVVTISTRGSGDMTISYHFEI